MKVGVLSIMVSFLLAAGLPLVAMAGSPVTDTDNDGIVDSLDNCVTKPNAGALFCDTDQDGYGNACDSDLDNNGATVGGDFAIFGSNFGAVGPNIADGDCNGSVVGGDFAIFGTNFGNPPGPSGLSCAGSIPCN